MKLMAIIGAAILANITNMAIMATLAWPLMSNNQTILGAISRELTKRAECNLIDILIRKDFVGF